MTLYEILKEKANNPKYDNKIVLVGRINNGQDAYDYGALKYKDILAMVDSTIKSLIANSTVTDEDIGKQKYVIVDNSINSVALTLALLKLGVIPVLIDAKNVGIDNMSILPYIYRDDNNSLIDVMLTISKYIDKYIKDGNISLKGNGGKLVIASSGSEGYDPHLNLILENDLIKLPNQYGENGNCFYSYISCANISGILTNIVNPIVNDCSVILTESFNIKNFETLNRNYNVFYITNARKKNKKDYLFSCRDIDFMRYLFLESNEKDEIYIYGNKVRVVSSEPTTAFINYKNEVGECIIDTLMFPRDIVECLKSIDKSELDFSKVKRIYLAGGVNSKETVNEIREMVPSIKEGVFVNLYGATEATGIICSCEEKDFKTCYIDISKYNDGKIFYTYDCKTIFKLENGQIERIPGEFSDFKFVSYLNVSNGMVENVSIDGLNIKMRKNGQEEFDKTGDLGIYIDDRLYVLGRKSDFVVINNQLSDIKSIEKRYERLLGVPVYCVKNFNQNKIQLYINYNKDDLEKGILIYEKALRFSSLIDKDIVAPPVLLNEDIFPISTISGKVSKARLRNFSKYSEIQKRNFVELYFDKRPEKRCLKEFLNTYFEGYEISEIDDDLCFTISLKGEFIPENFNLISYLFEVVDIDDINSKLKLRVLSQILFFVNEEIPVGLSSKYSDNTLFLLLVECLINENIEEIKTWTHKEIEPKDRYTYEDLSQIARNFIFNYINYLNEHSENNNDFSGPAIKMKLLKKRHDKIMKLLKG